MRSIESEPINVETAKLAPKTNIEAKRLLDLSVAEKQSAPLGKVFVRTDIKSSLGPFPVLPEYRIQYPEAIIKALGNLHAEYNQAFRPLVAVNREWDTDYQYCMTPDGTPINRWVQIDMVGLPDEFLGKATSFSEEELRKALRGKIFEIENSLAMYQLLENLFSNGQQDTLFNRQFRASLDDLRQRYGKPITLLAVTDQKYQAMKESEFGKVAQEPLTDAEVMGLSGFDRFFSPEEFKKYLEENGGKCDYLLYARTSDPVAKLRKPNTIVENPLLEHDDARRIIKANSLTFNVDNPSWVTGDIKRINDTKEYMPLMGMAYAVYSVEDLFSPGFAEYLRLQEVDPVKIKSGEVVLRAKPMKGAYGGYGHLRGTLIDREFRRKLWKDGLRDRGPYVVQPEMQTPVIINESDGATYTYIERVFLSTNGQDYSYMGGFRSLMPLDSIEAKNGRNHGSKYTVYSEIS